jgi:hypothetical protein
MNSQTTEVKNKKLGRPRTNFKEITKSSEEGTKEGESRATYILPKSLIEDIKNIAYWDRVTIKEAVTEALQAYRDKYIEKHGKIKSRGIGTTDEPNVEDIIKAIHYEPLLTAMIGKDDIRPDLKMCAGRHYNYALVDNNIIKYVGCTSSLYERLTHHKPKFFDRVYIMQFSDRDTAEANEQAMIKALNPKYNYRIA